jgi:transposase
MPAAVDQLTSPDDPDARSGTKRNMEWIGDNVHFTDTCDANSPHLMVNVETTPAIAPDDHIAAVVHESSKPRHLLPSEPLVEKGHTDAHTLVESQRHYGVTMVGPVADDPG